MTEDDIRLAMELFGGTGYNDPLSQYNRSREVPKPAPKRKSALDAARFPTLGRGTQPQIGLEPEFRDIDLKQREATIAGLSPLENLQAFGEGARTVGQAAVAGITQPFAELMGVPADKFYKAAIDLPETPGGIARGEQMIEGVQDFFGAMSESPAARFVEKLPFSPYSPASAQAIDTGLAQAGKGLKMAGQQAKQAGRQTLEAGKDLAQAARAEFATPPLGSINLGRESYVPGVEAGQELIVHHNITPAKLQKVQKVGGMPVPSIAISNVENPMMDFGDITLIGNPSMATPSAKNPVYGFDAYTARSPGISYIIDDKSKKNLADLFADVKGDIKTTSLYDLVDEWDKREYNNLMQAKFLKEKGKLLSPSDFENKWDYSRAIEKTVYKDWPEFKQWIIDFDNQLPDAGVNIKEKLFKGLTQEGRKRYVDANLENLVKAMKGGAGSEGFNYGVGNLRAIASPKFRKLDDVKAARDKIIPFEEFAKVKNQINSAYDNLWGRIAGLEDNKGYGYSSKDILYEIGQSKNVNIIDKFKVGADDKLKADIGLFIKKLKQLPTEYFEIKPQRAVNVSEFEGAIVPADVPKQSVDYLRSQGIDRIHFYSTPEERTQLFKKFQDKMFSAAPVGVGAAAMQEEEEQQYSEGGAVNPFEVPTPENLALDPILAEEREMRRLKRAQEMAQRPLAEKAKGALEAAQTTASTVGRGVLRPFAELAGQAFGEKGMGERLVQSAPQPQTEVGTHYTGEVQDVMQEVGKFLEPAKIPQGPYMPELIPSLPYANRPQMLTQKLEEEFATPPIGAVQLQTQQAPRNPLGMYSQAEQVALNLAQEKGTGNQFLAQISKAPGVKPAELEWTGLADFLKGKGDKPVTKAEIQQHLDANRVQVEEVQLGDTLKARELDRWLDNWADKNPDTKTSDAIMRGLSFDEIAQIAKGENQPVVARLVGNQNNPAKYSEYQLPGGSNYREVLLTLPEPVEAKMFRDLELRVNAGERLKPEELEKYHDLADARAFENQFFGSHFNQANILAHMRLNDRVDANGDKVLFVEEIQSDWGQKGREKGFKEDILPTLQKSLDAKVAQAKSLWNKNNNDPNLPSLDAEIADLRNQIQRVSGERDSSLFPTQTSSAVKRAPFVTNTEDWVNLSLKRLITDAVNNGYKKVAFINGEQSAARYDLSKQIDEVYYFPKTNMLVAKKGGEDKFNQMVPADKLADYVGKEAAEKLLAAPTSQNLSGSPMQRLSGVDLKVGGEGMKKFYDQIVPATANKLLKKLGGGKLEPIDFPAKSMMSQEGYALTAVPGQKTPKFQQLGFTITPEMVELVKKQGLPMFAAGGAVTMAKGGNPLKAAQEGMQAAKKAMKAQRREERVQKNLEAYMGSKEKPKTYYHATQAPEDFEAFDLEKRPTKRSAAAVFVTPSTDWASDWAKDELVGMDVLEKVDTPKPRIMPVITRAKNTFDYENPEHVEQVMSQAKLPESLDRQHVADQISTGNWNFIEDRNIQQAIKDLGFDSFNIKEKGVKNMGIFNPGDVKALFNRGSYDPTTADISKADGGRISADDIRQKLKNAFNFAGGGKIEPKPEEPKIAGGGMASKSLLERLRAYKKGGEVRLAKGGGDLTGGISKGLKAAQKQVKAKAAKASDAPKPAYSEKVLQSTTERMAAQIQKENPKMSPEDVLKKAQAQAKKKLTWEREEKPELEKTYGELKKAPYSASLPERKQNVPAVVQQRIEETERFLAQPTEPWEPPRKELQAFDRERIKDALEGFPGVEQTRFPRYQAPRSGALGMMQEIYQDPVNRRLIEGQIKRGLPLGGETFYASLYPLKLAALERGIPEQQFNQFVYSIAPASARNSIMNEMAVGQFLRDMNARGLPLDEETVRKEMDRFKAQYGTGLPLMPVHREGVKNVLEGNLDLREMSKADIPTSYKIPTYGTQKAGDFAQSMVLDVHEAAGQTRGSKYHPYFTEQGGFSQPEYGPAESEMLDIAQGLGIPGGMAQAGRWFGGGELTGLKSPRGDALDLLERQAAYTLQGQGINPTPRAIRNFVLDMVETGRGELMPYFKKTPMPDYRTEKKKGGLATLKG